VGRAIAWGLLVLTLAGCSEAEPPAPAADGSFDGLGLKATEDTGVLRGVVFDEAIRPLQGVAVSITGADGPVATATTNDDGAFGLDGLAPGEYFLAASKAGYAKAAASARVVAGLDDPDAVKILLAADPASRPYPVQHVMDGYLSCSARVVLTAYPAGECLDSDTSQVFYALDRVPDFIQSEMAWDSTQALGDAMSLVSECFMAEGENDQGAAYDPSPCPKGNLVVNRSEGSSPLVIRVDKDLATLFRLGDGATGAAHRLRVFAAGRADTDVVDEEGNNRMLNSTTGGAVPCVAWPALNEGCFRFTGVGVIANQRFTVYTTVFYGYAPPADWLFIADGAIPQPE
jgi:hypothetical protein